MTRICVKFVWSINDRSSSPATIQHSFHVPAEDFLLVTIETYLPSPSLVLYMPTKVGIKSDEI